MIIDTPDPATATGHVAQMYTEDIESDGAVFSHTRAMAVNPEAHEAFESLLGAVIPSLGVRVYELATLGAARSIGSPHCLLAHGRKTLRARVMDESQLTRVALDPHSAGLSESDIAVMDFAAKVSSDPLHMTDTDALRLREVGFTDRQIADIALAAAARNLLSRYLLALNVPVDEVPGLNPQVAEALLTPIHR